MTPSCRWCSAPVRPNTPCRCPKAKDEARRIMHELKPGDVVPERLLPSHMRSMRPTFTGAGAPSFRPARNAKR